MNFPPTLKVTLSTVLSLCLSLLAMFYTTMAMATSVADYAWQARLSGNDHPLQKIDINLQVLRGLTRADLGDIAVFDQAGQILAGWLGPKKPALNVASGALTFYRLKRTKTNAQIQRYVNTVTGKIVEIFPHQSTADHRQAIDYLIELNEQQLKSEISEIEMLWKNQPEDSLLTLKVDVANDLDYWKTIHFKKSLLNRDGKNKAQRITDIPAGYKYIRLTPVNTDDDIFLDNVIGIAHKTSAIKDIIYNADVLNKDKTNSGFYGFSQPLKLQAKYLEFIVDGEPLIKGNLYSSVDEFKNKKLVRLNFRQFSKKQSSLLQGNETLDIRRFAQNNWWFQPTQAINSEVRVNFHYPQFQFIFLPNGNGPYQLAWGNFEASAPDNDLATMLKNEHQNNLQGFLPMLIGETQSAGGEARLSPATSTPWMQWLLWFIFIAVIAICAKMAISLYRDMSENQNLSK